MRGIQGQGRVTAGANLEIHCAHVQVLSNPMVLWYTIGLCIIDVPSVKKSQNK